MNIGVNQLFPVERLGEERVVEFKVERPLTADEANNLFAAAGFHSEQCLTFDAKMSHPEEAKISVNKGIWENFVYVTGEESLSDLAKTFIESLPA